ncbi:MAG TPA: prolyl oligopeptidase family serine peptidase [Trebonia sp.]
MTEIAPYGTWKSPISATDVAAAQVRLSYPDMAGDEVWWQEGRPAEGGRITVAARGGAGQTRDLLPAPWSARTRVHEYGGKAYLPVPASGGGFGLAFANFADQRLYLLADPGEPAPPGGLSGPAPLTPDSRGFRFADMVLSPDGGEVWCVRETHDGDRISRAIVAVPLDGSAAADAAAIRVLVTGADFFAFPTPSPDGSTLAWINWDHPRMPWDGTELRVGPASGATVADSMLVMGGPAESVLAPRWRNEMSLYVVSDISGWWNLYLVQLGAVPRPLCPREEEFAEPLWQLGMRPFAVLGDGRLAVLHGVGEMRLSFLDPETGTLAEPGLPFRVFMPSLATSGTTVAAVAGGPRMPWSVIRIGPDGPAEMMRAEILREETATAPDPAYLPVPRQVQLSASPNGAVIHALVYSPSSPVAEGPADELPPYIVWVHGGPTGSVDPVLDVQKAYFTSRGIGIIDVNYGGSSGYGRQYRERLRGLWGIVDVADAMNAALALAESGEADGARLGIRGGSAGGWTALAAVTSGLTGSDAAPEHPPVFAAAVSYFGVTDLRPFAATTHDFESRYLDGLIGPLPETEAAYEARSPIGHVSPLTCPILLLQGLDDPVVPPAQAEMIARDLTEHGIPYTYIPFEGESHGFRKAETIIAALEAELAFYGRIMGFTPPGVPPITLA